MDKQRVENNNRIISKMKKILFCNTLFNMQKLCFLFILMSLTLHINAQTDTRFWFAAPEVSSMNGDEPVLMRVSTLDKPARVTISIPANPDFEPISRFVKANYTETFNLTEFLEEIENKPADMVLKKGILIEASAQVSAYYEVANSYNPEIFPLKGEKALGEEFYIPSQNTFPNARGCESFDIVATQNNTTVTITPSNDVEGHKAGETFTITLNRGETYSVEAAMVDAEATLAGSKVTSDKPIAITIKDDSIDTEGWDLIGDQIIPTLYLGKEYIVVKGYAIKSEYVYILATQNNTKIWINNEESKTLNEKDTYALKLEDAAYYISSDKPVYVYHLTGYLREAGSALLPPIECTGSKQVGFTRTNRGTLALIILTHNGNQSHFLFNGDSTIISPEVFEQVSIANSDWVYARIKLSTAVVPIDVANTIENTNGRFHLGFLNKKSQSAEYGYFSDYTVSYLGHDIKACKGEEIELAVAMGDAGKYTWSDGSTGKTLTVTEPGTYWVKVNAGACTGVDTINVKFDELHKLEWEPRASLIKGSELILNATVPGANYIWQDGSQKPIYEVTEPGKYWVELNLGACTKRYEVEVVEIEISFSPKNINFKFGKATLTKDAKEELNKLAEYLQENPDRIVKISAHTDNVGSPESNMELSNERAASVKEFLMEKGIEEDRLTTKGFGETKPIATNETDEGRKMNRRVEFNILTKQ